VSVEGLKGSSYWYRVYVRQRWQRVVACPRPHAPTSHRVHPRAVRPSRHPNEPAIASPCVILWPMEPPVGRDRVFVCG